MNFLHIFLFEHLLLVNLHNFGHLLGYFFGMQLYLQVRFSVLEWFCRGKSAALNSNRSGGRANRQLRLQNARQIRRVLRTER